MTQLDLSRVVVPARTAARRDEVTENVLDVRVCVLSGCPRLVARERAGRRLLECDARIYRASIPEDDLLDETRRNPAPQPGVDADRNPFLVRLLMSPDCVLEQCGVTQISRREQRTVEEGRLFS